MTDSENINLVNKYPLEIAKFKEFCLKHGATHDFEELDFYDLSVGFFIALGVTEDTVNAEKELFYDAFSLARICRYDFQYWC